MSAGTGKISAEATSHYSMNLHLKREDQRESESTQLDICLEELKVFIKGLQAIENALELEQERIRRAE